MTIGSAPDRVAGRVDNRLRGMALACRDSCRASGAGSFGHSRFGEWWSVALFADVSFVCGLHCYRIAFKRGTGGDHYGRSPKALQASSRDDACAAPSGFVAHSWSGAVPHLRRLHTLASVSGLVSTGGEAGMT